MQHVKRIILLSLLIATSIFLKINVYALDAGCTQAEQVRLRQLASATQITYDFYQETNEGGLFQGYKVTISNFTPDFYIYNEKQGIYFRYMGSSSTTVGEFSGGSTYSFPFYASDQSPCNGQLILTKNLQLIPYNKYSTDPLCVGHETYELCKKFTAVQASSQTDFERRMKQYINDLEKKDNPPAVVEKPVETKTIWQQALNFVVSNYMIFLVVIAIAGTVGIIVIQVKKRRSIL